MGNSFVTCHAHHLLLFFWGGVGSEEVICPSQMLAWDRENTILCYRRAMNICKNNSLQIVKKRGKIKISSSVLVPGIDIILA